MDPTHLDEYLMQRPIPTLRLTLSSGDRVLINDSDEPMVQGLNLVVHGQRFGRFATDHRMISIPNIAMIESVDPRTLRGRRR